MIEDEEINSVDKMIEEKNNILNHKEMLEKKIEEHENSLDKAHAERDSLRDKDNHPPMKEHEFSEEGEEEMTEEDEVGPNGKEEKDPVDVYGQQSHVKDYEKPSHMENHAVSEPKNKHYPHDLPHVSKVDQADFQKKVRNRVKLEKLADKYLDKVSKSRIDSMDDIEIKKKIILNIQKNAKLEGKSNAYINARFDSIIEDLPKEKVIANPSRYDSQHEKSYADASES